MSALLWTPPTTVVHGNARTVPELLPDGCVSMIACSPPFYGLRSYNTPPQVWLDGWVGELGQEPTVAAYVAHLVSVFAAWWRVLHPTGVLFVNLGDSYSNAGQAGGDRRAQQDNGGKARYTACEGLGKKQLLGVPWRFAFAMQDAGWILRADVVWAKGNPMPESVTDRFTRSHEYVFMFARQERYYFDHVAVQEPSVSGHGSGNGFKRTARQSFLDADGDARGSDAPWELAPTRNKRDVWHVNTVPFAGAHYATWPPALVLPMVRAGSSAKGVCPACYTPWRRAGQDWQPSCTCDAPGLRPDDFERVDTPTGERAAPDPSRVVGRAGFSRPRGEAEGTRPITRYEQRAYAAQLRDSPHRAAMAAEAGSAFDHYLRTDRAGARPIPPALLDTWIDRGWLTRVQVPERQPAPPRPALVCDPFSGVGTTGAVAVQHGRHYLGVDLNPDPVLTMARLDKIQLALLEVPA
jgi:site-specific DNA-methyltransferase (adenine-specific)